jgi:2-oxo-4-hydroxy-4-carboxy-5-ureidoimidazoline decarboxylase
MDASSSLDSVSRLNALPAAEARAELLRCCGSSRWADAMLARRPFADAETLQAEAEAAWNGLLPADWLEAFRHHPRIGDKEALRARFAATRAWAAGEQAGTRGASEDVLEALAEGNRAYEERFGYIFIVCATGKSADEMLAALRERLGHEPETEIRVAASEQARITRIRLEKLLGSEV